MCVYIKLVLNSSHQLNPVVRVSNAFFSSYRIKWIDIHSLQNNIQPFYNNYSTLYAFICFKNIFIEKTQVYYEMGKNYLLSLQAGKIIQAKKTPFLFENESESSIH